VIGVLGLPSAPVALFAICTRRDAGIVTSLAPSPCLSTLIFQNAGEWRPEGTSCTRFLFGLIRST
jgi:hypothetical protein